MSKTNELRQVSAVKVLQNTTKRRPDFKTIVVNGTIVHQGQPKYIEQILRRRYNLQTV